MRATTAEGTIEALLTKIAAERALSKTQVDALGALRQAYHELRKAIVRSEPLPWHYSAHSDYTAFKGLQTFVADLITRGSKCRPTPAIAARNFALMTSNSYEQTFPDAAVRAGVYYPDGRSGTALNGPLLRRR